MNPPQVFQLLRSFSQQELQKLHRFLESPVSTPRPEYLHLLDWWQQNRGKAIDREGIFRFCFPQKRYLERDWYLLVSRFQSVVESFLIWESLQADEWERSAILLRTYRQRKLESFFERTKKRATTLLEKRARYEARMLYWEYDLEQEYYDYIVSHNRQTYTNLQVMSDTLDHFFIAEKLKQACLAHSRGLANQEAYDIRFLSAIEQELSLRPALWEIPAIRVYASCYQAVVKGGTEQAFQTFRNAIASYQTNFPRQEMRDLYLLAINYCIRALNRGRQLFIGEAFVLYQKSLEEGYLLEDGHISESTFNNIVSLGLKEKQYNWIADFIEHYESYLKPGYQASVVALSKAKLAYEQGRQRQAMQQLVVVEAKAPFLYLAAKTMQMKIFYETEAWDALDSLLESMRMYLQRRDDLGYRKKHYGQMVQFMRRLLQLQAADLKGRKALVESIVKAEVFQEKEWFLEQIQNK